MLVVTLGDPFSINIEILASLMIQMPPRATHSIVFVGSAWQWQDQTKRAGLTTLVPTPITQFADAGRPGLHFLDVGAKEHARPAEALTSKQRGEVAKASLDRLTTLGAVRDLAVLTAPIDKHAAAEAGYPFPGQTEFFEHLWKAPAVMTLAGPKLRVGLVTNHLPLAAVADAITPKLVEKKLELFIATLRASFGIARPRVAICGVNPHAGDQGLFGSEDKLVVAPAVAAVAARHPDVELSGPVPADTAFYRAYQGRFDGVLAMYHDQGLGPLKTVHFDDAVNLSGGLPHFRASPDHGPASDLFLKGGASAKSFAEALRLAVQYLAQRSAR